MASFENRGRLCGNEPRAVQKTTASRSSSENVSKWLRLLKKSAKRRSVAFGERKEPREGPIWCHLSLGLAGANQSFEPEDPKYFFNSLG